MIQRVIGLGGKDPSVRHTWKVAEIHRPRIDPNLVNETDTTEIEQKLVHRTVIMRVHQIMRSLSLSH